MTITIPFWALALGLWCLLGWGFAFVVVDRADRDDRWIPDRVWLSRLIGVALLAISGPVVWVVLLWASPDRTTTWRPFGGPVVLYRGRCNIMRGPFGSPIWVTNRTVRIGTRRTGILLDFTGAAKTQAA